jgi:hypothetical protein
MKSTVRFSAIALLFASTLLLNACSVSSSAKSKTNVKAGQSPAGSQVQDKNDCTALTSASFEVETAMMGVGMATDMGFSMIDNDLARVRTAIAKVKALKLKDATVKALQMKYLTLVAAAIKPVESIDKNDKAGLKAVSKKVKAGIDAADEFRKDKIFFGDCK